MSEKIRKLKERIEQSISVEDYKSALKNLKKCAALAPNDFSVRQQMAQCLLNLGRKEDAILVYKRLAADYASDGLLLKAITINKMIVNIDSSHTETQETLANLYAKQKDKFRDVQIARAMTPVTGVVSKEELEKELRASQKAQEERVEKDASAPAAQQQFAPHGDAEDTITGLNEVAAEFGTREDYLEHEYEIDPETDLDIEVESADVELKHDTDNLADLYRGLESEEDTIVETQNNEPDADTQASVISAEEDAKTNETHLPPLMTFSQDSLDTSDFSSVDTDIHFVAGSLLHNPPASTIESQENVLSIPPSELAPVAPAVQPDMLPSIPLFSELDANVFIELTERMVLHQAVAGEVIIEEGAKAHSIYSIIQGSVRVVRGLGSSNEVLLANLNDGAFFGEMALLTDEARTASVVATRDTLLFEISKTLIDDIIEQHPHVRQVLSRFHRNRLLTNLLCTCPIFFPFSKKEKKELVQCFQSKAVPPDSVLITHKEQGDGLHILLSGECDVISTEKGHYKTKLAKLHAGDIFGEMSLLGEQPASASVVSRTPCIVLRMPKKRFEELIAVYPLFLTTLKRLVRERNAENEKKQRQINVLNDFLV